MKNHKRRFYIIIFSFLLIVSISWRMAITPSIQLYKSVNQQENQIEILETAPQQIALTEKKLERINQQIGTAAIDIKQENIVNEISLYIKNNDDVELCLLTPIHKQQKENFWINTYKLELQGSFTNLVQLLNYFEDKNSIGKIASTDFFLKKDNKSGTQHLRMQLYIQSFTKS